MVITLIILRIKIEMFYNTVSLFIGDSNLDYDNEESYLMIILKTLLKKD